MIFFYFLNIPFTFHFFIDKFLKNNQIIIRNIRTPKYNIGYNIIIILLI